MVKVLPIPTISGRVGSSPLKVRKIRVKPLEKSTQEKSSNEESLVARTFREFASNTALHGYNHIVREGTTKWEK